MPQVLSIGNSDGVVNIAACRSSVNITSSVSGDGTHGGFIGVSDGTVTFNNCLFDGSITGSDTTNCGGFVGWRNNGALTFNNCMQNGTISIAQGSGSATFNRNGSSTLNNCYYRTAYGDVQGTQTSATGATLVGLLGGGWTVDGSGNAIPDTNEKNLCLAKISSIEESYSFTGDEIKPLPTVTAIDGTVLTKDTDYTVEWSGDGKECGNYTLTVTAKAGSTYSGSITADYMVFLKKVTNETETYYEIGLLDQLKFFIDYVNSLNSNTACKGMTFKLTKEIGSDENPVGVITPVYRFDGIFDGGGHTITGVIINSSLGSFCTGFFCYTYEDSKIKNLTLKDILVANANSNKVGSICGGSKATIANCHATGTIIGNRYVGGIVGASDANGLPSSPASINNCSFSGTITAGENDVGGIVGFSNNAVNNCTVTNTTITADSSIGGIVGRPACASSSQTHYEITGCKAANISFCATSANAVDKEKTGYIAGYYNNVEPKISDCIYEAKEDSIDAIGMYAIDNKANYNWTEGSTRRYTVHCGENVTATYISGTTYDVDGVTCYDSGATFTISDTAPVGRVFKKYVVKDGLGNDITNTALSGTTLTMPADTSVVVTVEYTIPEISETYIKLSTAEGNEEYGYCTDGSNIFLIYKLTVEDTTELENYNYVAVMDNSNAVIEPTNISEGYDGYKGEFRTVYKSVKFSDNSTLTTSDDQYILAFKIPDMTSAPQNFKIMAVKKTGGDS